MPNPIVGLVCICGASNAADLFFYDYDGNSIGGYQSTGSLSINGGSASDATAKKMYCCDGKCANINANYTKVNVPPNGSYFVQDHTTYVCSADGVWRECASQNSSSGYTYWKDSGITARRMCPGGYKTVPVWFLVEGNARINDFCSMPWEYLNNNSNNFFNYSDLGCSYKNSNGTTNYTYSSCMQNYYYEKTSYGNKCTSCGNPANGHYNTDNHTNTSCNLMCDNGYYNSNGTCTSGGGSSSGNTCPNGQFDLGNYGGDSTCHACPSGAKCDGDYVLCPVGSYVYSDNDGAMPYCRKCPGHGQVDAYYDDNLKNCTGRPWDYSQNITTNCLWTDFMTTDEDDCYEYSGSDATGTYEFRDGTNWEQCYYSS